MGLRDDKKRKARLSIERAALTLILERSFDEVTVEDICAVAEVSKKTFFNYFPTKDAAVLGWTAPTPSREELLDLLETRSDENYLDILVGLLAGRFSPCDDPEVTALRTELFSRMPQCFFQGRKDTFAFQQNIGEAVLDLLLAHPERRLLPDVDTRTEAFLASSCASNVARVRSKLELDAVPGATDQKARALVARYLAVDAPGSEPDGASSPSPSTMS